MHDILLSFSLIILTGIIFRHIRIRTLDASSLRLAINVTVFNVFLPALCIKTIYTSKIDSELLLVPATSWITITTGLLVSFAVYTALERSLRITPSEKAVLVIAAVFGNLIFLGLPVLTGLYGDEAAKYALFYEVPAASPLLWLVAAPLAARYGRGKPLSLKESVRTLASLPPLWGLVIGVLLRLGTVALPVFVVKTLDMFSSLVVPLMIFSIGLVLTFPKVKHACAILPAVIIKLVLLPFVSLAAAWVLGLQGTALAACFLEGAMPTMVVILLIAAQFDLDQPLAAFVIAVTTALSFLTLPAVHYAATRLVR